MEPIVKVDIEVTDVDDYTEHVIKFFHSADIAKRWCENDCDHIIEWSVAKHVNPFCFWSPEITLEHNQLIVTYTIEPVEITVLDEEDGEV